jgi:hypothetical protein
MENFGLADIQSAVDQNTLIDQVSEDIDKKSSKKRKNEKSLPSE